METTALISFIGIILGVAVFIALSFKGNNLAVSAAIGAIVILLFGGVNVVTGLTDYWVAGLASSVKSYFMIFTLGGIFGKIMDVTGGAKTIAYALLKIIDKASPKFKPSCAVYFLVLMYFICTYVGIHGFIVVFTVLPIGRELFHDLNIPWRYYCYGSGGCIAAYYLLGSVSSVPSVAATLSGSHVGALPVLSVLMTVLYFVFDAVFINLDVSSHMKKGEGFLPGGDEIWKLQMESYKGQEGDVPMLYQAAIPMVVMIVIAASGIPTMVALTVGCVLAVAFMGNRLKGKIKSTINGGATSVFVALINVCGAAALGTVIKNMAGYTFISDRLNNADPLFAGVFLAMFGTLLLGSSSSSMPAFGEQVVGYFQEAGLSAAATFRLFTAVGNFMYPPHNTGVVNASGTGKIPYKDAVIIYIKSTLFPNVFVIAITLALIVTGVFS